MAEPFIGQITPVGFNFAPRGFAFCNGQLQSISSNTALFSLLGTTYGGDGKVTYALPDLRGRTPIHQGQGPGLPEVVMGEMSGEESVTLISTEMPMHSHLVNADNAGTGVASPTGAFPAAEPSGQAITAFTPTANTTMNIQMIGIAGGSIAHNNLQPLLTVNYIIALEGIFPARN